MPTVSINNIRKAFGAVQAVDGVSFEVEPGEFFGLLGPNGAGKTTTIRMILNIFKPDSGEIAVFGGPLDEAKKNRIGYLPEDRGLYKDLKLEPTLVFLATLKGLDERTAHQCVGDYLKRLDLYDYRQKKIQELSRGIHQKAQIVATLAHGPDLIIVDEPFAGLDPVNARLIKEILKEERQAGKTIVMSAHEMHQVETMCDRIVLINKGRVVLYGKVDEIKRQFAGNAVVIEGQGDFSDLPGVLETRRENNTWRLVLAAGASPQDVLRAVAAHPAVKIERFEIAEPSLDDIFVTVVQGEEAAHA
jgi:ABC-2 type transport system ATP-binding protein